LLSGGFFGISLAEVSALSQFKKYFLDDNNMMILAIALGAVHVVFAKILDIVNTTRRRGFKFAIEKIGWLVLLLSAASAFGLPMLGITISNILMTTFYVIFAMCGVAIFFYNTPGTYPEKQVSLGFFKQASFTLLKQTGMGVWNAYNFVTGLLGDLLSYIRLFALGLAGAVLGMVFNSLAFDMSPDIPFIGGLVTLIILLFGHSLNFALMMLGAFVHPLRLTFVEFYKNAGFEGGGREYAPFKKVEN
jgi:V/A-type H+-transporting ATPase subunit I